MQRINLYICIYFHKFWDILYFYKKELEENGIDALHKAVWVFKKSIDLNPEFVHEYTALGAAYIKQGETKEVHAGCINTAFCDTKGQWSKQETTFECPDGKKSALRLGASIVAALALTTMMWNEIFNRFHI